MADDEMLRYPLPEDVFHYEPKYFAGLTVSDMLIAAIPAMLVLVVLNSLIGAAVVALIALGLMKRFASLGNRSPLVYAYGWFKESRQRRAFVMPRVLTGTDVSLTVTTWEGEMLYRVEGVDDTGTADV